MKRLTKIIFDFFKIEKRDFIILFTFATISLFIYAYGAYLNEKQHEQIKSVRYKTFYAIKPVSIFN